MTDHYTNPINARALTSRLTQVETDTKTCNDITDSSTTMSNGPGRSRASSFELPKFSKSSTMSTMSSSGSGSDFITPAVPRTKTNRESVEIGVGEFSKPRVNKRSRRDTIESTKSESKDDFRYYGRHANQWLFNDFSVTDSIKEIGLRRETKKVFDVHACSNLKFDRVEGSCSLVQQRIPATIGSRDVDACAIRYLAAVFMYGLTDRL
jgi:hypothetical protein